MLQRQLMRRSDQRLEFFKGRLARIEHTDPAVAGVLRMREERIERGEVERLGKRSIGRERVGKELVELLLADAQIEPVLARARQSPRRLVAVIGDERRKRHHATRAGEEEGVVVFELRLGVRECGQVVGDLGFGHAKLSSKELTQGAVMQIPLTDEQMALIKQGGEKDASEPIYMINSQTGQSYLLLEICDDDDISHFYPAQFESAWRAGWGDPIMDEYDNYDEALKKVRQLQDKMLDGETRHDN